MSKIDDNDNKGFDSSEDVRPVTSWDDLFEESDSNNDSSILSLEDLGMFAPSATDSAEAEEGWNNAEKARQTKENQSWTGLSSGAGSSGNSGGNAREASYAAASAAAMKSDSFSSNNSDNKSDKKKKKEMKKEKKKNSKKKKKFSKLSIKAKILIVFLVILLLVILAGCGVVGYIAATSPEIDPSNIYAELAQTSSIYDDSGNLLEYVDTTENRTYVTYDQIPQNMVNAIIAIEDKTFYTHHGFNLIRIAGAIVESLKTGDEVGGTSTVTQQLARNLYLTKEHSMIRKLREAYYAILLEKELTKDQIMEAYLNTVFFGFNSYGVQAAAKAYFNKDASQLTLEECATLAAIPKSPEKNAPLKRYENGQIADDNNNIVLRGNQYTIVYNDAFEPRQHQILDNMLEMDMITQDEYNNAYSVWMKNSMHPQEEKELEISSYSIDYLKEEVLSDLESQLNITEDEANQMLYSRGLKIYSTINVDMQKTVEAAYETNSNFPGIRNLSKDGNGNILDSSGNIMLYNYGTYFDASGNFLLTPDEYSANDDGSMTIYAGKRLNIYKVGSEGSETVQIEFKNLYTTDNGSFYVINGGILSIDGSYLTKTESGDALISSQFFADPNCSLTQNENGWYAAPVHYSLRQKVIQPQSAMVITDWTTGQIKAMVGGRGITGRMLYNRADNPRQPGSSIKPLAVYGAALQLGVEDPDTGWTAGTTVADTPNDLPIVDGKPWPKNWYSGYKGNVTIRTCVQQSINVCSVKLVNELNSQAAGGGENVYDYSIDFLKKLGVTTIDEENDRNPAALGLGGMTKGISPIQMAAAYGTFPNKGQYIAPSTYTKVVDSSGNTILEKNPEKTQVMDEGVAFIMSDILRTTVSNGIAGRAAISGQPAAGKTGTTTDNYDAWFVGFTPQYAASVWIGNDYNVELSNGSSVAASLWSKVMGEICNGLPRGEYEKPDNVYTSGGEYYVEGTSRTGARASGYYNSSYSSNNEGTSEETDETGESTEGTDITTDPSQTPDGIPDSTDSGNSTITSSDSTSDSAGGSTTTTTTVPDSTPVQETVPEGTTETPSSDSSPSQSSGDTGSASQSNEPELPPGVVSSDQ